MFDQRRAKHLKEQWESRTDLDRDELLHWLLKAAWPTRQAQNQ